MRHIADPEANFEPMFSEKYATFTLPEGTSAVTDKVAEIAPERKMSPFKIYVNPAFIRYVTGTDHQ